MFFTSQVLYAPKDAGFELDYEDAFCVDGERGLAAIADGVSNAIFSADWARILTRSLVTHGPCPDDPENFATWLAACRQEWQQTIDFGKLSYFQKAKLRQVGGAYATVCWLQVYRDPADQSGSSLRVRAYALGDSCLFHVREGSCLSGFPITESSQFGLDPASLCSVRQPSDTSLNFHIFDEPCLPGDLLLLATDAVADYLFRNVEAGHPIDTAEFTQSPSSEWGAVLEQLRNSHQLRRDDSTLVRLAIAEVSQNQDMASATLPANGSPVRLGEDADAALVFDAPTESEPPPQEYPSKLALASASGCMNEDSVKAASLGTEAQRALSEPVDASMSALKTSSPAQCESSQPGVETS